MAENEASCFTNPVLAVGGKALNERKTESYATYWVGSDELFHAVREKLREFDGKNRGKSGEYCGKWDIFTNPAHLTPEAF